MQHPPARTPRTQHGGTFLGFVIGLVVGVSIALAVAVYVTKVPIPFLNKGPARSAEQDAGETQRNKTWDPNAPLYGKNPARPAAAPASAASDAAAAAAPRAGAASAAGAAAPVPAAADAKAAKPTPEVKPAVTADPLGDLAQARSKQAAEPFEYWVQVGAYRSATEAEAQRAKLSLAGIDARVTERDQNGKTVHRVRVGPFDTRAAADQAKARLDGAGLDTALVRVQR